MPKAPPVPPDRGVVGDVWDREEGPVQREGCLTYIARAPPGALEGALVIWRPSLKCH